MCQCIVSYHGDCGRNVVLSCVLCAFSAGVCNWALFVVFYQNVDYFGSLCGYSRAQSENVLTFAYYTILYFLPILICSLADFLERV